MTADDCLGRLVAAIGLMRGESARCRSAKGPDCEFCARFRQSVASAAGRYAEQAGTTPEEALRYAGATGGETRDWLRDAEADEGLTRAAKSGPRNLEAS